MKSVHLWKSAFHVFNNFLFSLRCFWLFSQKGERKKAKTKGTKTFERKKREGKTQQIYRFLLEPSRCYAIWQWQGRKPDTKKKFLSNTNGNEIASNDAITFGEKQDNLMYSKLLVFLWQPKKFLEKWKIYKPNHELIWRWVFPSPPFGKQHELLKRSQGFLNISAKKLLFQLEN